MKIYLQEKIGNPDLFTGRRKELSIFSKWIEGIPKGISIKGDKEEIYFYPDGHSDKVIIELENQSGEQLTINVRGYMGNAEIKEGSVQ